MIRSYFDSYSYFDTETWVWSNPSAFMSLPLGVQESWNLKYQKYRMRRGKEKKNVVCNNDVVPSEFWSIERDADQFHKRHITIKDTFGIEWVGKKSIFGKWSWKIKNTERNISLYNETRKRTSETLRHQYIDRDKIPFDFASLEKDAKALGISEYRYVDFFGIEWVGKKGKYITVGQPDVEGSLFYYDQEYEEYLTSEYNTTNNLPPKEVFVKFDLGYPHFRHEWVDISNVKDIKYSYVVENHLFKDTRIELIYGKNDSYTFYSGNCYSDLVKSLKSFGKDALVSKLFKSIDEHFEKLKNSSREEERDYYPGKTAKEYFDEESK